MPEDAGNITAAGATADGGLMWRKVGLNGRPHNVHERAAKQPPETPGKLKRTLTIHGVGVQLFPNPEQEVQIGAEDPVKELKGNSCSEMSLRE